MEREEPASLVAGENRYSQVISIGLSKTASSRTARGFLGLDFRLDAPVAAWRLDHLLAATEACRHEPAVIPAAVQKIGSMQPEKLVQYHTAPAALAPAASTISALVSIAGSTVWIDVVVPIFTKRSVATLT